jgi:hypothetical protein
MKKSNGLCLSEDETILVEEDWAPRIITRHNLRRELGLRCYLCKWALKASSLWSTLPAELKVKIWDALLAIPALIYMPFWDQIRSAHDGAYYRMARFHVCKATWNPVDLNRVPVFLRQTCMLNYAFVKEEDYGPSGIDACYGPFNELLLRQWRDNQVKFAARRSLIKTLIEADDKARQKILAREKYVERMKSQRAARSRKHK